MFLTKANIEKLPPSAFVDAYAMKLAVFNVYACGITIEVAERIIQDFAN